ncbi:hypothetical protein ACFQFR_18725 [Streptomyces goshikiensis]
MPRTAPAGAVALAAAVAVLGSPGGGYGAHAAYAAEPSPQAGSAYRPAEGAKKVEGKPTTADAPLVDVGGVYSDTLGPGERLYRLGLDDNSSVYVSAVVQPPRGAKVGYGDGIEVEIITTEGRRCQNNTGRAGFGYDPVPVSAVAVRRLEEDAECQGRGTYFARVTRTAAKDSDQRAWPVELKIQREPGLGAGSAPTTAPSVWPSASPRSPAPIRWPAPAAPGSTTPGPWAAGCGATTCAPGRPATTGSRSTGGSSSGSAPRSPRPP